MPEDLTVRTVLEAAGLKGSALDAVVEELARLERATYNWRLVRQADSAAALLELGALYDDLTDQQLNMLLHSVGENLVKAGLKMVQSEVGDDDEDGDLDVGWDVDEDRD